MRTVSASAVSLFCSVEGSLSEGFSLSLAVVLRDVVACESLNNLPGFSTVWRGVWLCGGTPRCGLEQVGLRISCFSYPLRSSGGLWKKRVECLLWWVIVSPRVSLRWRRVLERSPPLVSTCWSVEWLIYPRRRSRFNGVALSAPFSFLSSSSRRLTA